MTLYIPLSHHVVSTLYWSQDCNTETLFMYLFSYTFLTTITIYSITKVLQSLRELILRFIQTWDQMETSTY